MDHSALDRVGSDRRVLTAICREDFYAFVQRAFNTLRPGESFQRNWHLEAIAHALDRVRTGETKRLIITLPPRSLKSIMVSVAFPAFVMGHDPSKKIICASYSDELATKHARDFRALIVSDWYRQAFPRLSIDRKNSEQEIATTRHGFRYATSVGGTLTGRGGNLVVIDDPIKPQDAMSQSARDRVGQWFENTVLSRLDNKENDAIIIIMQRVHVDDLVGRLLEQGGWEHLCLPAIAEADEFVPIGRGRAHKRLAGEALQPERESLETLHALKNSMGAHNFAAQYQQNPVPPEGSLIKRNWIKFFDAMPARKPGDIVVQSWDTAIKSTGQSDYSVCVTALIRGNDCFVLDVFRDRLDFPDLCREVIRRYREWSPKVALIEEAGSGASLLQQIRRDRINTKAIRPEGSKELRMARESIALEAGRVYFRQDAPWLGDLMNELLAFPASKHDDQVDALSQLLGWMDKRLMGHQIFV